MKVNVEEGEKKKKDACFVGKFSFDCTVKILYIHAYVYGAHLSSRKRERIFYFLRKLPIAKRTPEQETSSLCVLYE
ncbi:hypothetical protein ANTQUA_LOCUS3423 [Anthophora quadrimaculata]